MSIYLPGFILMVVQQTGTLSYIKGVSSSAVLKLNASKQESDDSVFMTPDKE